MYNFVSTYFYIILGVLNANLSNTILDLMSFNFKLAKQTKITKIKYFLFLGRGGGHKYTISVVCVI